MPNIVNVSVSQQVAPAPTTLQSTGAFVSQGATTLAAGTIQLITQPSDLTGILRGATQITSMAWSTGVVTVTTTTPHGIPSTDVIQAIITGVTPTAYNGTYAITSTGTNTFTYALATNPGVVTTQGAMTYEDVQELVAMTTTFFAQSATQSVYILELGVGTTAQGVTALQAYITNPTVRFYSYLGIQNQPHGQWSVSTQAQPLKSISMSLPLWQAIPIGRHISQCWQRSKALALQ